MDQTITQWINAPGGSNILLDSVMVMATQFGVPLLVLLVMLQWWSRHERLHVRHTCAAAGLSFLVGVGLNQIILLFVHRVRPYDAGVTHLIISRSGDWSFPSDHATVTFAIAASFLLHGFRHFRYCGKLPAPRLSPAWARLPRRRLTGVHVAHLYRNTLRDRRARGSRHGNPRRLGCLWAL